MNREDACVQIYGSIPDTDSRALFDNLALGKSTTQSSTLSSETGGKNAVDGFFQKSTSYKGSGVQLVTQTDVEAFPWWEVDLGNLYSISSIIFYMVLEEEEYDPSNLSLILYDDENEIKFRHYVDMPKAMNEISIPLGTYATRVRFTLYGEKRSLSLSEVIVIEFQSGPTRFVNLPIGVLWAGKTIDLVSFHQISNSTTSETYISDMTFENGFSP